MDRQNSNTAAIPERSRGNQNWFWLIPFVLLFMPLVTNEYQQYIINLMLIYVPVAIGFNLVTGNLGQLAFSNLAFFSAGAYTSGVLSLHLGWPWWTTIVPAGLLAGGLGALVGSVALRGLRGFYLDIAPLARSDERRVGKECVSSFRSRCSPYI